MPDLRPSPADLGLKLAARVRTRGPLEVARLGVGRLRRQLSSDAELIVHVRAAAGRPAATAIPGVRVVATTPADGRRFARDIGTESPATFAHRLTTNTSCFAVEKDDRLLHTTWTTRVAAWTREVRRYFRPPSGDAYAYESYTRPEARGWGLWPLALQGIADVLAAQGVARLWVAVEADNAASIRAVVKAGFEPVLVVGYRRRWGRIAVWTEMSSGGVTAGDLLAREPPSGSPA